MTTNDTDITFDANSGISEEEQREILAQINGIAEKNRLSLSGNGAGGADEKSPGGTKKKPRFKATKRGGIFPVLVNIAAIAALAGGFLALSSFQGKTDAQVREGTRVYNSAERALIEEIRRETSSRLEAKEYEISLIRTKLANIDDELYGLYSNNEELDAEQLAAEDQLKALQEEYRATLAQLLNERSRILEEARTREATLQAQLESRTRELALVAQQSAAAIDLARAELDRLSGEQAQAAAVEAQMGAFFANLNIQLGENRLDDASATIAAMKDFLNTPSFQALRSIQARKDLYAQAIDSFETMVAIARNSPIPVQAVEPVTTAPVDEDNTEKLLADLQTRNTRLEQNLTEKDRTIAALSSSGEGAASRIAELEGSVSALRTMNNALEAGSNEKNEQIRTLESENRTLNQSVVTRTNTINQIQGVMQGKAASDMTLGELSSSILQIQDILNP